VVSAVIALQIVLAGLLPRFEDEPALIAALISTGQMIGLTIAAGALVLVHNVYGQAAPQSRSADPAADGRAGGDVVLRPPPLHRRLSVARAAEELYALRGAVLALLVVLFALAMRRPAAVKVQLSRAATFQSLSVLAILAYLIVMMSASRVVELAGGDWMQIAQLALLVAMSGAALVLVPSAKARRWVSVVVQKHLFQHRYDYREEWLRFTNTVGGDDAPIGRRVAKAMADIGGAPGRAGAAARARRRLVPGEGMELDASARSGREECGELIALLEETALVIDFAAVRDGRSACPAAAPRPFLPGLAALPGAWAGIPLIHCGRLPGAGGDRAIRRSSARSTWEDYDLFRAAGRQAASYLAEARTSRRWAEARGSTSSTAASLSSSTM
jgi:hypothetical protein